MKKVLGLIFMGSWLYLAFFEASSMYNLRYDPSSKFSMLLIFAIWTITSLLIYSAWLVGEDVPAIYVINLVCVGGLYLLVWPNIPLSAGTAKEFLLTTLYVASPVFVLIQMLNVWAEQEAKNYA